jgi:hypothetical protein
VTGGLRKLHNEELHGLYSSPYVIRVMKSGSRRLARHVARIGEMRSAYKGRKRPIRIPRRGREDNIKMYVREKGLESLD